MLSPRNLSPRDNQKLNLRANEEHNLKNLAPLRGIRNENKKESNDYRDKENSNKDELKKLFAKKNNVKTDEIKREITNEEPLRGTKLIIISKIKKNLILCFR
jgi:hypothetical protein